MKKQIEGKNIKYKKSSYFTIFFFIIVNIIISILVLLLELLVGLIIDIKPIINNISFSIIKVILIQLISVYLFIKIFNKRYILNDNIEIFLNKFLIFIILFFSLSMTVNIWSGLKTADSRIYSLMTLHSGYLYSLRDNPELYNEYIQNTPYINCKNEQDIRKTTKNVINDIIHDELIDNIIVLVIEISATTIFMCYFIKKLDEYK